jgi:hypothetical protein
MEVSGQLHAPAALPQGESPWYPLDRRLGGPQSRCGEEKNSQSLQGLDPPVIQPVAQRCTTELPRLLGVDGGDNIKMDIVRKCRLIHLAQDGNLW